MNDQVILLPILIPLAGAMLALLARRWQPVQAWWSFGVMTSSTAISARLLFNVAHTGEPLVVYAGGWVAPFGITFVGDLLALFLVFMSQLVITLGLLYAIGSKDQCVKFPSFYPLFLTLCTGLCGAFLTGDIFNLFVFVELLVISGTILTAIADDRAGAEAAYKYFYISLLSSVFLLMAISALYISYGTLNMADLAMRIAENPRAVLLPFSIAMLLATFMVKSAAFPFHFWQPDFHAAAPTSVSALLSSVVVKLGVYGFLRMTTLLFIEQATIIQVILIAAGIIGVFYGGLAATHTSNAKRMLAYSTIGQIGFILIGIGWGSSASIAAALVFTFNHSLVKSAMLMLAGYLASRAPVKTASFEVIRGLGKTMPFPGILFFLGGMALAGLPPTNGFISKMLIFRSGLDGEHFWILGLIGLGSVISLFYTMRAFQRIWWYAPPNGIKAKPYGDKLIAPGILIFLVLLFGMFGASGLINLALQISDSLLEPLIYIGAVIPGG